MKMGFALGTWICVVLFGMGFMMLHDAQPGAGANAPARITRSAKPKLLVFFHPQCPCSMATAEALDRIRAAAGQRVSIRAYFCDPDAQGARWYEGRLWNRVKEIPGIQETADPGGRQAHRFHAATSGQALLYSPSGKLVFSGGLTPGRGHEGDCGGLDSVLAYLNTGKATLKVTPVYGCALFSTF